MTQIRIFIQVKNLSVAREMVKSMAVEAQASRVANGLIMQKGEGKEFREFTEKNHTVMLPIPKILLQVKQNKQNQSYNKYILLV